jgi:hypothetical protein
MGGIGNQLFSIHYIEASGTLCSGTASDIKVVSEFPWGSLSVSGGDICGDAVRCAPELVLGSCWFGYGLEKIVSGSDERDCSLIDD